VALAVALLAVTGLFVTSLMRLLAVDPGFSPEGVVALEISPVVTRYPDTKARTALYDRIAERARQLPGVRVAAWTSALPLTGESSVDIVARPDDTRPTSQKPSANYRAAGFVGALVAGTVIRNLLFEVRPGSVSVLGSVVIVVATVSVLAAAAAARQGLRINPVAALRNE